MSAFAELDENNVVVRAVVADSAEWLTDNLGGTWVETFDDGTRGRMASIGFFYDDELDAFYAPSPSPSWVLNEELFIWEAPAPYPADGGSYVWDESAGAWVEVEDEAV
jgi:hypothetical protein